MPKTLDTQRQHSYIFIRRIKRIVFEAVHKYDGFKETPLSVSQMKQIAGRAGRFGLHGNDAPGGLATTMAPNDLPLLREAMSQSLEPLRLARLTCDFDTISGIVSALPKNATPKTIAEVLEFVSKVHPSYQVEEVRTLVTTMYYIDMLSPKLNLADRVMFLLAPIPWRDQYALKAVAKILSLYSTDMLVDVRTALEESGMWEVLEDTEQRMRADDPPRLLLPLLMKLESIHKVSSLYLWLSYRMPIAFFEQDRCFQLKQTVEGTIAWCLSRLTRQLDVSGKAHASPLTEQKNNISYVTVDSVRRDRRMRKKAIKEAIAGVQPGKFSF